MKNSNDCLTIFKDNFFNKKTVLKSFKTNFYGYFDVIIENNTIICKTDLPLHFEVKYKNSLEKREIYAFLRYILNSFDFSFTLEFNEFKELKF